jgi:hypothetical protein
VVSVGAVREQARGARPRGAACSRVISLFVEIKQVISCKVSVIMVRAAVPPGQSGQNGHTRVRYAIGERLGE